MLSEAKHLSRRAQRCFASLSMTALDLSVVEELSSSVESCLKVIMINESKNVSFSRPYREEDPMATEQNATNIPLDALSHRFVDANGLRIHIVEQGTGPLMLLCHGFPELWYSWRHQFSALAKA